MKTDPLPPHSDEAERGILACIFAGASPIELNRAGLSSAWFFELRYRKVFEAAMAVCRDGANPDVLTVSSKLIDFKDGIPLVAQVADEATSAANWSYWLDILRENAQRRAVLSAIARLKEVAIDSNSDPAAVFADAEAVLDSFRRSNDSEFLPDIVDAAKLISEPISEPRELVSGILHQGAKLVLGGGSKSFKTWALLDLALSVSHGAPWLSFDTTAGRVIYLNMELPSWAFHQRITEVAKAKSIKLEPGQFDLWNLRGHNAGFDVLFPKIKRQIEELGHSLIVLDPIYKLYGRADENSAGDVARLMNALEDLSVSTGAAVAFGAHFSKGNQAAKESIDRISGSGVFARDPDSILVLTRHEEQDAFTLESTLRNFRPCDPFVIRWEYPLLRPDNSLDPKRLKQAGGRTPEHAPEVLLEALPAAGLENQAWRKVCGSEHGIKERTFYRLRSELVKRRKVLRSKINGKWLPLRNANER